MSRTLRVRREVAEVVIASAHRCGMSETDTANLSFIDQFYLAAGYLSGVAQAAVEAGQMAVPIHDSPN
jgi:hypothetical protein